MGELINGCDTVDNGVPGEMPLTNACAEIEYSSDRRAFAPSISAIRFELEAGRPVMLVAASTRHIEMVREALDARGIASVAVVTIEEANAASRDCTQVALIDADDIPVGQHDPALFERLRLAPTMGGTTFDGPRITDDMGWIVDPAYERGGERLNCGETIHSQLGRGMPNGDFDAAMLDGTMDRIFGDDVIAEERRRRSCYVLIDDDHSMARDLGRMAVGRLLAEPAGYNHRDENDAFNRGQGRKRVQPTRGRYPGKGMNKFAR